MYMYVYYDDTNIGAGNGMAQELFNCIQAKDWQCQVPLQGRRPCAAMWRLLPSLAKDPEKLS